MAFNVSVVSEIVSATGSSYKGTSGLQGNASSKAKSTGVDGDSAEFGSGQVLRADVIAARQASKEVSEGLNTLRQAGIAAQAIADNLILMQNLAVRAKGGGLSQQERWALQSDFSRLSATNQQIAAGNNLQFEKIIGNTVDDNLTLMQNLAVRAKSGRLTQQEKWVLQSDFNRLSAANQQIAAGSDLQVEKATEVRSTDIRWKPTRVMDTMRDEIAKFSVSDGNRINFENWAAVNSDADIVNNPGKVLDTMRREIAEIGGVIQSIEAAAESLDSVAQAIDGEVEDILRPELRIDDIKTAAEVAHGIADAIEAESADAAEAHAGSVTAEVAALLS